MEGNNNTSVNDYYEQQTSKFTKIKTEEYQPQYNIRESTAIRATGLSMISVGDDKKNIFKIIQAKLSKKNDQRSQGDKTIVLRLLKQENLLNEFLNDDNVLHLWLSMVKVRHLQEGQYLFRSKQKDSNMYKIIKGQVAIKRGEKDVAKTKGRGQYIQSIEEITQFKQIEAFSRDQCYVLYLNNKDYEFLGNLYAQNKKVKNFLGKTPLLSKLKRKQMSFLFQRCQQITLGCRQKIFCQGDHNDESFYFVVDGQVAIFKKNISNRKQLVCYISSGSIFGQQILFDQEIRTYSVVVHSSQVRLLVIKISKLMELIGHFQLVKEEILTSAYKKYLQMKQKHYCKQVQENSLVRKSFHQSRSPSKMSPLKQKQISYMLRGIENSSQQLTEKEKLLEKRYQLGRQMMKEGLMISVDAPLFKKQNFPGLKKYMRREPITETKNKSYLKLPALN